MCASVSIILISFYMLDNIVSIEISTAQMRITSQTNSILCRGTFSFPFSPISSFYHVLKFKDDAI